MKNLVLVRHAESEWGYPSGEDVLRKLTEKGKSDAIQIATRLNP